MAIVALIPGVGYVQETQSGVVALVPGGGFVNETSAPSSISFSSATTDGADVLAASIGVVVGFSSTTTDGADVLAANVSPTIGISSATTDGADVLAANISLGLAPINFSSATTDGADAFAASVGVTIGLSSATTDGADNFLAYVNPVIVTTGRSQLSRQQAAELYKRLYPQMRVGLETKEVKKPETVKLPGQRQAPQTKALVTKKAVEQPVPLPPSGKPELDNLRGKLIAVENYQQEHLAAMAAEEARRARDEADLIALSLLGVEVLDPLVEDLRARQLLPTR